MTEYQNFFVVSSKIALFRNNMELNPSQARWEYNFQYNIGNNIVDFR